MNSDSAQWHRDIINNRTVINEKIIPCFPVQSYQQKIFVHSHKIELDELEISDSCTLQQYNVRAVFFSTTMFCSFDIHVNRCRLGLDHDISFKVSDNV